MNIETGVAVWNAAVEACSTVAENCEPDDHGYLSIQEIAETIRTECSVFMDGDSKMTERMVPVELLERILSITQPIAPAISAELSSIIDGPGVEPFAYYVYFPDAQDGEFCEDLDDLIDRLTNERHEVTQLYCAAPSAPEQAVPDSWQLVPIHYKVMLAAAPQPPATVQSSVVACHTDKEK